MGGGGWLKAGYALEIQCPGLKHDTVTPVDVTVAPSDALWRTGRPSPALIILKVRETRKPLNVVHS